MTLTAISNCNTDDCNYEWSCIDVRTGSPCFSRDYQYIRFDNAASVTIGKDLFFENAIYSFDLTIIDDISLSQSTYEFEIFSSADNENIAEI